MSTKIYNLKKLSLLVALLFIGLSVKAQTKKVLIIKDSNTPFLAQLENQLKEELNNVLMARYEINYISFSVNNNSEMFHRKITDAYANNEADLVVGLGFNTSAILHQLKSYPIPTIATMVFNDSSQTQSNISNYTYTRPYKSFTEVVHYFSKIYTLKSIGVLGGNILQDPQFKGLETLNVSIEKLNFTINEIPAHIDGIIITPQLQEDEENLNLYIKQANKQQIPTLSVTDNYLKYNCTVAIDDDAILLPLIKQTALNSLAIFEGENPSKLKIKENSEPFEVLLNMEGARTIQKLPNWEYLENLILTNIDKLQSAKHLGLSQAIALGLQEKLSLKKSKITVRQAEQDIKQAKGNLTPNLSAGIEGILLSDNLVEASLGQKGERTVSVNLSLQQILFSEPVFANIAITKLLKEKTSEENRQDILDGVVIITQAYISALLTKAELTLHNENLNKTKANLAVAKSKETLGVSKQSDVNRWISELNMNKIQLSAAQANYKNAMYGLNERLNQPIASSYELPNNIDITKVFNYPKELLAPYLKDEFLTEKLAGFYLSEMKTYAPELHQIRLSEEVINRRIKSNKRKFFLPEIVGFASANDIFSLEGLVTNSQLSVPSPPEDLTWSAGLKLSIPILNRRTQTTNLKKAKLDKELISYSKLEVENALEKGIRTQVQQFKSSYVSYNYAKNASNAAYDNYIQAEDAYQQGFITVTQLLEAQEAKFNTNLLVFQTNYKMGLDYLLLERLTGKIQFLDALKEQEDYLLRIQQYLLKEK
jgi:outer membrane protein TolC